MANRRRNLQQDFENKMDALEEAQRQKMEHIEQNKIEKFQKMLQDKKRNINTAQHLDNFQSDRAPLAHFHSTKNLHQPQVLIQQNSPNQGTDLVKIKLDKIEQRLERANAKRSSNLLRSSAKLQLDDNKLQRKEELLEAEQFHLMNKVITKHLSKEKFVRKMNMEQKAALKYQISKNEEKSTL